jgi:hypothetical protein
MRGYLGTVMRIAMLCGVGLSGCGGGLEEGIGRDVEALTTEPYQVLSRAIAPGVPSELSGLTYGDGFFFSVHRDNATWRMVITQLAVTDWTTGTLRSLAQGSVAFNDPEGLSYIDKRGDAWRFVAAAEGGSLTIAEMNGNTVTLKASKQAGTYGNDGIEGVCYFKGFIYYGLQRDGKVYRVRFNTKNGTFGDKIESVPSSATSVRDMTEIEGSLYSINGTLLTRVAGTGAAEIHSPITLSQLEGVAYASGVIMVGGEPNEYGMFAYPSP